MKPTSGGIVMSRKSKIDPVLKIKKQLKILLAKGGKLES